MAEKQDKTENCAFWKERNSNEMISTSLSQLPAAQQTGVSKF